MWIFIVVLAKKINLISQAQYSKPVLDAGDSCTIYLQRRLNGEWCHPSELVIRNGSIQMNRQHLVCLFICWAWVNWSLMHTEDVFSPKSLTNINFWRGCCEVGGCALIGNSCPGLPFFTQEIIPRGKENGMKVLLVYGLHLGERDHSVSCLVFIFSIPSGIHTFHKS